MVEKTQPDSDSGTGWPCKPTPDLGPLTPSGWPTTWPTDPTPSPPHSPTPLEQSANKGQLHALYAVADYLNSTLCPNDDDNDYVSEYDDDVDEGFVEAEAEEYEFFAKLFRDDVALTEYYVKNRDDGVFCCLVCCGVREKGWKRFKNCVALVQHSVAIAKTKKRRAHRAYCRVVCEILGWDVNRLPAIVPSACDESSVDPAKAPGNVDDGGEDYLSDQCKASNSECVGNSIESLLKELSIDETKQAKDGGSKEHEHVSLGEANTTVRLGHGELSRGIPETTKENAEGVVCQENCMSKAGTDRLVEDLSYLTSRMLIRKAEVASSCMETPKECSTVSTDGKDSQEDDTDTVHEDDTVHKNHK